LNSQTFGALGLDRAVLASVRYGEPTPIQRQAIPHVLEGRDLLGCAQTGTGKTAAFALPILDILQGGGGARGGRTVIRALVLAPTRELAAQIGASFQAYGGQLSLRTRVIFGGVGKQPQVDALRRGIDILVATPGRLLDLMGDGVVNLESVEMFVLDEADRMLDMGFIDDVRRVVAALPSRRQTLLFSATMPPAIRELSSRILRNPIELAVDPVASTAEPVEQAVHFVESARKLGHLLQMLGDARIERALVFTRTKHRANRVARDLEHAGVAAAAIHGNKSQSARERALAEFRSGKLRVVVATDIAARGLDIKELDTVVNFDMPQEPETYVHRIGRTGRAGASGSAVSLCAPEERALLSAIERLTKKPIGVHGGDQRGPARRAPLPRESTRRENARESARGRSGRRRRSASGR
jgi:ATP-dependent RNA helicase RhlE